MEEIIKDKLKQAPKDPGVYQFLNSEKKIIYIGKAKNIRTRIKPPIRYISTHICSTFKSFLVN